MQRDRPREDVAQRALVGRRARRRSLRAARSSPPSTEARSSTPAAVSVSAFTRRSPSALRRSTIPRASSRSTSPVTFEASQKSRSASALIGIGSFGVEHAQGVGLREAEAELGQCRAGLHALGHADLEEEPLCLVRGGRSLGNFHRHCFP